MKKEAFKRTETVVIAQQTVAAVCMAVVILEVTPQKVKVRSLDGWHGTVSTRYVQPFSKTFPDHRENKLTQFDKQREKNLEKPPKKFGMVAGAPALLSMPVVVQSADKDAVLVLNDDRQYLTLLPRHVHVLPAYLPFLPNRKQESIYLEPGSEHGWTCVCGNDDENCFYPSDIRGNELTIEVDGGWDGLYTCQCCGRVFHMDKLIILDQNIQPVFLSGDEPSEER